MTKKKEEKNISIENSGAAVSEKQMNEEMSNLDEGKNERDFLEVLKIFSPGTAIRTSLDDILRAGMGALIVIDKEGLSSIMEGGFRINSRFSAQKLVELAKMDGAIVLSQDLKKILYANTLLTPSAKFQTKETGTRHKAAERTARQFGTIVIAISERKKKITLFYKDESYFLEDTSEILRRAAETLQVLEKQTDMFNDLLSHLNILEITNLTTMSDVCSVLQTLEMIRRISDIVKRYLIELGKEGTIVSMRLKELTRNLTRERDNILKDYFGNQYIETDEMLKSVNFDFLLETSNILRLVFGELHDEAIAPRGGRILGKMNLLEKDRDSLLETFGTLDKIFSADVSELKNVFKNENLVNSFLTEIKSLKEKIMMGKKI